MCEYELHIRICFAECKYELRIRICFAECKYELHIRICFAECKDLNVYFMCNVLLIYKEFRGAKVVLTVLVCLLVCVSCCVLGSCDWSGV